MNIQKNLYIVQAILGRRKRRSGSYIYKVKWKDYPIQQCTWQPAKHLEFVKGLVKRYDQQLEKKKSNNIKAVNDDNEKQGQKQFEIVVEKEQEQKQNSDLFVVSESLKSDVNNTKIKKIRKNKNYQNEKQKQKQKNVQDQKYTDKYKQTIKLKKSFSTINVKVDKLINQAYNINLNNLEPDNQFQNIKKVKRKYIRKAKIVQNLKLKDNFQKIESEIKPLIQQRQQENVINIQAIQIKPFYIKSIVEKKTQQQIALIHKNQNKKQQKIQEIQSPSKQIQYKTNNKAESHQKRIRQKRKKLAFTNKIFQINHNPQTSQQNININDDEIIIPPIQPPFQIVLIERQNKLRQQLVVILQEESESNIWHKQLQNNQELLSKSSKQLAANLQIENKSFKSNQKLKAQKQKFKKDLLNRTIYAQQCPDNLQQIEPTQKVSKDQKPHTPFTLNNLPLEQNINQITKTKTKKIKKPRTRRPYQNAQPIRKPQRARKKRSFAQIFITDNNLDKFPHIFKTQLSRHHQPQPQPQKQLCQIQQQKPTLLNQLNYFQPSKNKSDPILNYNKQNSLTIELKNQEDQKCVFQIDQVKKYFSAWLKQFYQAYI